MWSNGGQQISPDLGGEDLGEGRKRRTGPASIPAYFSQLTSGRNGEGLWVWLNEFSIERPEGE